MLLISAVVVLGMGSVRVPSTDVVAVVTRRLGLSAGHDVTLTDDQIVWQLRLPRVVAAAAVGAALAQCGCVLQSLTGNDLADPYLLGVSNGAAVGAVAAIILGWRIPGIAATASVGLMAFLGATVALALVLILATGRSGSLPAARTILAGVAIGQIAAAFTSLVTIVFGDRDGSRSVMMWMLGSFSGVRMGDAAVITIVAIAAVGALTASAHVLDAFAFGDVSARSLGIAVERARWIYLLGTALVTATTVALVGPIGFVGLMVPHGIRLLVGPAHRVVLPLSSIVGALLMLWSDTAARTLAPGQEIPIGVVTAVLGAPVFVALLRRQARAS